MNGSEKAASGVEAASRRAGHRIRRGISVARQRIVERWMALCEICIDIVRRGSRVGMRRYVLMRYDGSLIRPGGALLTSRGFL